jgi:mannosyltransferase
MTVKKPIQVYFDNCIFVLQKIGGISLVFRELLNLLKQDKDIQVHMLLNGQADQNLFFKEVIDGLDTETEPKVPGALTQFMPLLKKLPSGSIFHSTYYRYTFQKSLKRVITIHDLGYERKIMQVGIKRAVNIFFKKIAIRNADAIICVSETTRDDLYLFYPDLLKGKTVKVIYNGLSPEFLSPEKPPLLQQGKYILYVGGRQHYKNFEKVVMAMSSLPDFHLVIAGGGKLNTAHAGLLDSQLKSRYLVRTDLSTQELKSLYSSAFCLVYPSSYEGFGLPLLEAMACGCPVVTCDNSCLREVSGGAAILITEPRPAAIVDGILALNDAASRADLIEKGKLHASKFSWERTVHDTVDLYNELIEKK